MKELSSPGTIWRNGILIRAIVVYLPAGVVAGGASSLPPFFVIAGIFEALCSVLFKWAREDANCRWLFLLSYLSVGDVVWFLSAIALAIASSIATPGLFLIMIIIWLICIGVNIRIANELSGNIDRFAPCWEISRRSELGASKKHKMLKRLEAPVSVWLAGFLIIIGMGGVAVAYIIDFTNLLLLFASFAALGLSCGFSPQLRPFVMELRSKMRG